jgi:hypothetical protein
VTDAETAVVPEFTSQAQSEIVIPYERPPFYDAYVGMDPGFNDNTGILLAYWDYPLQKLVIEDELILKRANTDDIAFALKAKEEAVWGKPPLVRVSDVDLRLIADLYQRHGLVFQKGQKQDSLGAIDTVRTMIRRREIIISSNCHGLIRQLRNATWNRKATDFERTQEDAHFDLLAALKYLSRAIIKSKNPFPDWYSRPVFGTYSTLKKKNDNSVFSNTPLGRKLRKKFG